MLFDQINGVNALFFGIITVFSCLFRNPANKPLVLQWAHHSATGHTLEITGRAGADKKIWNGDQSGAGFRKGNR
jgi:hypothetical protein